MSRRQEGAAFAFGLVGIGSVQWNQVLSHLTAIELLQRTRPTYDIVSLQTKEYHAISDLQRQLVASGVKPHLIATQARPRCRSGGVEEMRWFEHLVGTYSLVVGLWNLTEYRKVLYLDSDAAVLRGIDHTLRTFLQSSAQELRSPISCRTLPSRSLYNTGVWGVSPSSSYAIGLRDAVASGDFACGVGFQTLASAYGINNTFNVLPLTFNVKADQRVSACMNGRALSEMHVLHWSGSCKPATLGLEDADLGERDGLKLYQHAYFALSKILQPLASKVAAQAGQLQKHGDTGSPMVGTITRQRATTSLGCDGFVRASPVVYNFGRRCGNCCGAPRDTTSAMCVGATGDGLLKHVGEAEVRTRCAKDENCRGYYAKKGVGFRPFSDRVWVTASGPRFCDGWIVYEKGCSG